MAKEKKPSIYSDRGTIGSSEELDEYGVWVKSEPQDLSSEEVETPELNAELSGDEDMDFAIPEIEDLPDFGSIDEKSSDDLSLAELPTDDFSIPDIESGDETETESEPSLSDESGSDDPGLGDLTEEAGFDSLDIPSLEESPDSAGLENSPELSVLEESELEDVFDFPEIDAQDQKNLSLDVDLSETESNDDFAGISMDNSIDDLIENFDVGLDELPDGSMEPDSDAVKTETDSDAVKVETDSDTVKVETEPVAVKVETEPVAVKMEPDSEAVKTETDSGAVDEGYVPSAVPIQTNSLQVSGSTAPSSPPDLSTQLLMKIAEELSSIRAELSSLKKEFSGIRAGAAPAETEEGGFFDKEDDEKISLTGDELNNILNTADFTEEAGTDVTMGLTDDDAGEPDLLTGQDLEIVADSASLDLPEDIGFPEEAAVSDSSAEVTEEKEGEPITHAVTSEDTNYLAKEPIEADVSIDLEEVVIDEPVLSQEEISSEDIPSEDIPSEDIPSEDISPAIQDNPVEEPLPEDLSVNLDIEAPVSEDAGGETISDVDIASNDLGDLEIATEELGDLDINPDDLDNLGIVAEELGDVDIASDDLGDLEIAAEEVAIEEPGTESSSTEEPGTEEAGSGELSILELGVEDFDTTEPALEELSTGPAEEEPVSEEDFGVLAADEKPEEDFGVLVVDEPSGEIPEEAEELHEEESAQKAVAADAEEISGIPRQLKQELKTVLSYMDQLLEALPDEKIEEFARSEYYDTYKKLFKELGIA